MEKEPTPMPADWECYRWATSYGREICKIGDAVFDYLYGHMNKGGRCLLSEHLLPWFVGLPYDYTAFRGVTAYIARKAAKMGLCYVVSPVLKYTADPYNITVTDFEMALIRREVQDDFASQIALFGGR